MKRIAISFSLCCVLVGVASAATPAEMRHLSTTPFAVSTFHCLGLYWSPPGGAVDKEVSVRYRRRGATRWQEALPMRYNPIPTFYNTLFQSDDWLPTGGLGGNRIVKHTMSRNNILQVRALRDYSASDNKQNTGDDFDYDLYNGRVPKAEEKHGVRGEPIYAAGAGFDSASRIGRFQLAANSPGAGAGEPIPNFSDVDAGQAPDIGAHQRGAPLVQYGVRAGAPDAQAWRQLPLITNGKVDPAWCHVGWGGFVVDDGALRTECDAKGLGLLVYKSERFGNCQLRVVFKSKEAKSNGGVFVRIADGILDQVSRPGAAFDRDSRGKISKETMGRMMESAEREEGPWFAVHRGYEVQIMDAHDNLHRTGAIYSLAPASTISNKPPGEWKTMIITLAGNRIFVDVDGQRTTSFDPESPDVSRNRQWFEPKREPKRPESGYIGLQNHDPGDVVWIKEISVRPY